MKTRVYRTIKRVLKHNLAQRLAKILVRKTTDAFDLDLLRLAHQMLGIMNYRNTKESGEYHLVSNWLKLFLEAHRIDQPCFFDVGANNGDYSSLLWSLYPNAQIFAFEPNPYTFQHLQVLSQKTPHIHVQNSALGSSAGHVEFYYRHDNVASAHATLYEDILTKVHNYTDVQKLTVPIDSLDNFCRQQNVDRIDFLKIDTEGYEIKVLEGASNALRAGIIHSIQFEFNEMNIYSRVFLKDFVEVLCDFNLYRLLPMSLLPIQYRTRHEIFQFQNFLAVRKDLDYSPDLSQL